MVETPEPKNTHSLLAFKNGFLNSPCSACNLNAFAHGEKN